MKITRTAATVTLSLSDAFSITLSKVLMDGETWIASCRSDLPNTAAEYLTSDNLGHAWRIAYYSAASEVRAHRYIYGD